ncbi:hypothetical protein ES707_11777 [subsurface metagenome]
MPLADDYRRTVSRPLIHHCQQYGAILAVAVAGPAPLEYSRQLIGILGKLLVFKLVDIAGISHPVPHEAEYRLRPLVTVGVLVGKLLPQAVGRGRVLAQALEGYHRAEGGLRYLVKAIHAEGAGAAYLPVVEDVAV